MAGKIVPEMTHFCVEWNVEHSLNKKRLKNVGPMRHCEPPHANVHNNNDDDDNDNDNA